MPKSKPLNTISKPTVSRWLYLALPVLSEGNFNQVCREENGQGWDI